MSPREHDPPSTPETNPLLRTSKPRTPSELARVASAPDSDFKIPDPDFRSRPRPGPGPSPSSSQVHEEFWRGTLDDAAAEFTARTPRGEITLVVEGAGEDGAFGGSRAAATGDTLETAVAAMLSDGASPSEAARRAAGELGARKKEAYALALRLAGKQP